MTQRARTAGGSSWIVTLGGAALLIVVGFAVGLVAGVAYEEPDLVVDQLVGRTTEVPLAELQEPLAELGDMPWEAGTPAAASAETPPVAAAPPQVALPTPARAAEPAPALPRPSPRGGFSVQVGAFNDLGGAEQLLAQLRAQAFEAYLDDAGPTVPARFRVRVGPVATRAAAGRLAARLKDGHRLPTWVLAGDQP